MGAAAFTVLEGVRRVLSRRPERNIAMGTDDPERVMELWMNSPSHRANILKSPCTPLSAWVAIA